MRSAKGKYLSSRMGMILELGLEEILGDDGVKAVLFQEGSPEKSISTQLHNPGAEIPSFHVGAIQTTLERVYGPGAGRGIALQVGRACFNISIRVFGGELGLTDLSFRLLPLSTKITRSSEIIAAFFKDHAGLNVYLEVSEKYISWNLVGCPLCFGRKTDDPACFLAVGFLQEAFSWLSAGKFFNVEEKKCLACGDTACTIILDRTPMR
jgi:predicted hydrocarbon binding protein